MENYIQHHGILGQKWGRRRYQNPDGTLTSEGRQRYGYGEGRTGRDSKSSPSRRTKGTNTSSSSTTDTREKRGLSDKQKRALKIGAVAAGVAVAGIAAYKLGALDDLALAGESAVKALPHESTSAPVPKQRTSSTPLVTVSPEVADMLVKQHGGFTQEDLVKWYVSNAPAPRTSAQQTPKAKTEAERTKTSSSTPFITVSPQVADMLVKRYGGFTQEDLVKWYGSSNASEPKTDALDTAVKELGEMSMDELRKLDLF